MPESPDKIKKANIETYVKKPQASSEQVFKILVTWLHFLQILLLIRITVAFPNLSYTQGMSLPSAICHCSLQL